MKELYFVRHGESEWNVANKICGRTDVKLTARGREQAANTGLLLKESGIKADVILSSPLRRARDTADAISKVLHIPVEIEPRLIEMSDGSFEGTPRDGLGFRYAKEEFATRLGGGESILQVGQRIFNLLDELRNDSRTFILVAHNGLARVVHAYFNDMTNEEFAVFGVGNAEFRRYVFEEKVSAVSTEQIRMIDSIAINDLGIPSLELMENAAAHVTSAVIDYINLNDSSINTAYICGTGNNGGDGYASARQLLAKGFKADVFVVGNLEKATEDARANIQKLEDEGINVTPYFEGCLQGHEIIVDALFGVGLSRDVGGVYKTAIEEINSLEAYIISCDVPSGINGNTGEVMGVAVKSDVTVTFTCAKYGLLTNSGSQNVGKLIVADIGIPESLVNFN